ncbi:MAG: hypothetical protein PPP58_07935 [Natronomonas sp.]
MGMNRTQLIDRAAVTTLLAGGLFGLLAFRAAVGWHLTDPYLQNTIVTAFPPTAWVTVVPVGVLVGLVVALSLYRASGVPLPGGQGR